MTKKQKEIELKEILGNPMSEEKAINLIRTSPEAYEIYQGFPSEYQKQVLEFIQGIRGLPILYDAFFKKVLSPSVTPERLERFLSSLMDQKIRIIDVLPRDGSQLVDKGSLVIMDVLVQTEDGSFINVEMQKHGYEFTGERSTCYMSDLVMRQYTRVKSEKKKKFSFKDIKPVYLIVLMEESTKSFKKVYPDYIHRVKYVCDTGADINFLANYIYVSLDSFRSVSQNINSYLDAWFTFLTSDAPDDILKLIKAYPEFKDYYHDIALFRKNPRELMNMYSEALLQMDKNTVNYMIEEMQKEVEELTATIGEQKNELVEIGNELAEKNNELAEKNNELAEKDNELAEKDNELAEKNNELAQKNAYIKELESKLAMQSA